MAYGIRRVYAAQNAADALHYLTHSVRAGQVVHARCARSTDLTVRPAPESIAGRCKRCGKDFGVNDERWWIVPMFDALVA